VPLLIGLDPATALFTAGIGTLIFHLITKGIVPIFLGISFAFIAPIKSASEQRGMTGTIAGIAGVPLVYFLMSALIKWQGKRLLARLFPPVVIAPVIEHIGDVYVVGEVAGKDFVKSRKWTLSLFEGEKMRKTDIISITYMLIFIYNNIKSNIYKYRI